MKKIRLKNSLFVVIALLIGLSGIGLNGQQVSTCEELGLRPIEPGTGHDLLMLFLETDKFPERGCIVHHHPNGKDYVVTPADWGKSPEGNRKTLINDAMHAMTYTRVKYVEYGSLNSALFYIFDNVTRGHTAGTTFWLIEDACWMVSGVPNLGESSDNNRQIFAHEIGHCFVMENVPDLRTYYSSNKWFDESVSEFLSSVAYPENNMEFRFSTAYDLDGDTLQQPYRAYPLWYYLSKERGKGSVVQLMNSLASYQTKQQRLRHLRSINFDQLYQHFLFDFYQNEVPDSGGRTNIPSEPSVQFRIDNGGLLTGDPPPLALGNIPSERLSIFELTIPADHDLRIDPPVNSSSKTFFSILSEKKDVKDWVETEEIQGLCGNRSQIYILASHLSGEPVTGTRLNYKLVEKNYCCEAGLIVGENPSEEELDGKFSFDYYIESYVNYKTEGDAQTIPLKYYVNSKDGSILFIEHWFKETFGTDSSGGMDAEAVVWLPNGQLVAYVIDRDFGQKRAITLDLNQTRSDVMGIREIIIEELLREAPTSGVAPAPLPPGSTWEGFATGYAYYQPERSNPSDLNLITAYISNNTVPISSPLSSFGFMAGYIQDIDGSNKRLVYTRMDLAEGGMFETHLESIEKSCASFDATGYKKMTIGSSTGAIAAMTESERQAFADSQNEKHVQMMMMLNDLESCRGDARCEAEVQKRMMELEREIQNAVFDLPENSEYSGNAASEFQQQQRAIRDDMHQLQEIILDEEIRCERLRRLAGATLAAENCEAQLERYKNQMQQLNCRLARLQGVADMFEECLE